LLDETWGASRDEVERDPTGQPDQVVQRRVGPTEGDDGANTAGVGVLELGEEDLPTAHRRASTLKRSCREIERLAHERRSQGTGVDRAEQRANVRPGGVERHLFCFQARSRSSSGPAPTQPVSVS
jgi:hypothetical protein